MVRDNPIRLTSYWQLQTVAWVCFYSWGLVGNIPEILRRPGVVREHSILMGLMFSSTFVLHPVCRWLLWRYPSLLAFEWRALAASVATGVVIAFLNEFIQSGVHNIESSDLFVNCIQFPFVLFMWCSLYFSIKHWNSSSRERERLLRAEAEVREARLQALRYQLNPHFLFNSLNAVSTLVLDGEASAATKMLSQIGDFLRTSLTNQASLEAPLSQEMAFTEQYIAIEKTRLGERLQVNLAICPDTLDAMVPGMLLQPLIENAVRHGVASLTEGGKIGIESGLHEGRLRLIVRNSGRRCPDKQGEGEKGIGKRNISERLQTLYGNDHQFRLEWPESGGCIVTVELPVRRLGPPEASPC
jgi:two-component system sensor histidine kinase AlgZ